MTPDIPKGTEGEARPEETAAMLLLESSMEFQALRDLENPDEPVNDGYFEAQARHQIRRLVESGWSAPGEQSEVERLTAEVERLRRDLAAWTSGRRRKAWPRIESVPDAIYHAAELARSQGTEGGEEHDRLLREASQRMKALNDTAQVLLADREALSGLLRGMARRVGEWRRTSARHYAEFHQAVEDWGRNDEQALADSAMLAEKTEWLSEACRLTVREAAAIRGERDKLLGDATSAREKLMELVGGDWTVEPSLNDLATYAARFWGDDRRELAACAEWKQAAEAKAELLAQEQAERCAEVSRLREQLAAVQALVADFRQRAEQTVATFGEDSQHDDGCDSAAECHASAQHFTWKLAAHALEKALASVTPQPCVCNGGWSVDENYQPEDYERNEPLRPEKGLIPCGFCNHGGWDAPWPPENEAPRAAGPAEAGGEPGVQ